MRVPIFLTAVLFLAGCGGETTYDWGRYEDSVSNFYGEKHQQSIVDDRMALASEIEATEASGKRVPPGKYAHVGYLAYLAGDNAVAANYFECEKKAFPESAPMMDRFLRRLQ
jgi:hypothetical protein